MSEKVYNKHIIITRNLIWRTLSRLLDKALPKDHPGRFTSRVNQGMTSSIQRDTERQIQLLL